MNNFLPTFTYPPHDKINIVWLKRDLRLQDNSALYHALKQDKKVLLVFIFDDEILKNLNVDDKRVNFIYQEIEILKQKLNRLNSDILVLKSSVYKAWEYITEKFNINNVYTNSDYEPYAINRDNIISDYLYTKNIILKSFKDHVIFEKNDILKDDGTPYTVFTPYFKKWLKKLNDKKFNIHPSQNLLDNLISTFDFAFPKIEELGFTKTNFRFPSNDFEAKLMDYEQWRDYPAFDAGTYIGIHLRFGTVSIRETLKIAFNNNAEKFVSELAWRDFYMMIIFHFPKTVNQAFKPKYDFINWINNENDFKAWCTGKTGYPLVDAGMRQLNETGYMHNRVRMLVASFLCKHLLIDWRWGEAYFAEKLLDYEQASNVGGWQWACGCGNDAAPYFRIFNPELQQKKFDKDLTYIQNWIPELNTNQYPSQIINHAYARDRVLKIYKEALNR